MEATDQKKIGAVMVVGAGIPGIQAALDLADSGFYVYIVEKNPAIGGTMPKLDKTFPTNDCSMCILAPKLVEAGRHLNIEILAPAQVEDIAGEPGNYRVTVRRQARYIDMEKCIACGVCAEKCPKKVPDEFNQGLNSRKAAYVMYPQAVPLKYAIDKENCIFFKKGGKCKACEKFCPTQAVNLAEEDLVQDVEVGGVILASGFKPFDARLKPEYGYGRYPNVITSLEFERILSASGPTQAHVKRPSDGADPKKVAWIQCVGSRDPAQGRNYCSSVCCMYATKQAIIAREHDPNIEPTIFYIDLRAHGKGFDRYYQQAQEKYEVRYIRSIISRVTQDPRTQNLELTYVDNANRVQTEEFNLVVLSIGLGIDPGNAALAQKLGVDLTPYNFVKTASFSPVASSRPGIFSCGCFTGPKDIPDSVMEGSAAAAAAARVLADARGTLIKKKEFPPEKEVDPEPRVGVFICHCGVNIGGIADIPACVEYARTIADVAYAQENLFSCSQDAQNQMAQMIQEHNLNRVVVAACSPTTHGPMFQNMLREAGLNKYLFEMANIRNQCTWVHQQEREKATEKSKDLINMAVAKARLLQPLEYIAVGINRQALVIGGGVAGMSSALALADQGYGVHLVEQGDRLGGQALKLHTTWKGENIGVLLNGLVEEVNGNNQITVHLGATVEAVSGFVGNFTSKLSGGKEIEHGVVVMATGGEPYKPEGQYLYGQNPNVLLTLDLDQEIAGESQRLKDARAVAFIQCVGSRIPERQYCSRVCCTHSLENAVKLKEMNPKMDVSIIYRDIRAYGERETVYEKARKKGVLFFRYDADDLPKVEDAGGKITVTVKDDVLQRSVELPADLLVLASAIVPYDNKPVSELYKLSLNPEGFFSEAHAKIRPVDCATDGIYLAGLCQYPKPLDESIAQALASASRASTILSKDSLELESTISHPIDENCDGCAFCVDACPYKAITLMEYMYEGGVKKTVDVNEVLCKGCGSCMATCPKQGIYVAGFTPEQLSAQVEAALGLI